MKYMHINVLPARPVNQRKVYEGISMFKSSAAW